MPAQVVVLGGGVGGTLTANLLARQLGRDVHVTVVDPTGMHLYQPGFLYAALGKANGRWLARDERTLLRREVDLAVEAATLIDGSPSSTRRKTIYSRSPARSCNFRRSSPTSRRAARLASRAWRRSSPTACRTAPTNSRRRCPTATGPTV